MAVTILKDYSAGSWVIRRARVIPTHPSDRIDPTLSGPDDVAHVFVNTDGRTDSYRMLCGHRVESWTLVGLTPTPPTVSVEASMPPSGVNACEICLVRMPQFIKEARAYRARVWPEKYPKG